MKRKKRAAKSSDFPSKKRKLGKGKRPAENATNISFKSRSIVIPSQLQPSQQPTGKRKLNFEALLRHLNHFKSSMRCDGLTGLRELFQDHPHLLLPNLAKLVEKAFGRIIDSDTSVRHSLYTLLTDVFAAISSHHIRAHFPSIVVHISCGLTHISDGMQLDALKIFGVLMNCYPTLLPPHAQELLPLIVGLISRHKDPISSKKTRAHVSLAHDPVSKLSKLSSRIDVFNLLSRFLETLLKCVDSSQRETSVRVSRSTPTVVDLCKRKVMVEQDGGLLPAESTLCNFSASVPHIMPLQGQGLLPTRSSSLSPFKTTSSAASTTCDTSQSPTNIRPESVFSDFAKFIEFAESIVTLLLECWVECAFMQVHVKKGALPLMDVVIYLLCLVLKLARHVKASPAPSSEEGDAQSVVALDVLSEKYTAGVLKHFMTSFPLHCPEASANFTQYVKMNLVLCQITTLLSNSKDPSYPTALQKVCTFYETLQQVPDPSNSSQSSLEWSRVISGSLPGLLVAVERHRLEESYLQCVLTGLTAFYSRCHPQSSAKRVLIHCFRGLLKDCTPSSFVFSAFLLPWLESLPQLLVDLGHYNPPLSAFIIDSLTSAASHISLSQLEHHLTSIIGPNSVLTKLPSTTQRRFSELLWLFPTLKPELLSLIREWVTSGGCADSAVASFVVETVHHSFQRRRSNCTSAVDQTSHYMVFMLELLLSNRCTEGKEQNPSRYTPFFALLDGHSDIEYKMKLIEIVCESLRSTHFSDQVLELASPTLQAVLGDESDVESLTLERALGILCLVERFSAGCNISGSVAISIARLCLSVLWHHQMSVQATAALDICCRVVNNLLKLSQKLLMSLLELFATPIEGKEGRRDLVGCFVTLLDSTELNSALRKSSSIIHSTAAKITAALRDDENDIYERIKFSIMKFPTRT